jgi:hypothetical protein
MKTVLRNANEAMEYLKEIIGSPNVPAECKQLAIKAKGKMKTIAFFTYQYL